MPISQQALDLATHYSGLADAYKILKEQWLQGERDREIGLLLFFIAWQGIIEPGSLTGFGDRDGFEPARYAELNGMLTEVHAYLEPQTYDDVEILFVI